jgi:hypothetical protein
LEISSILVNREPAIANRNIQKTIMINHHTTIVVVI